MTPVILFILFDRQWEIRMSELTEYQKRQIEKMRRFSHEYSTPPEKLKEMLSKKRLGSGKDEILSHE